MALGRPLPGTSTFVGNLRTPIHRWYRYSAGYSATWAADEVRRALERGETKVLDPFAGSGTTLLAADEAGAPSHGFEAQPFVWRVCRAKLRWDADPGHLLSAAARIVEGLPAHRAAAGEPGELVRRCFDPGTALDLTALARAVEAEDAAEATRDLLWLALVAIVRRCSHAGTAPWQYVLPSRRKAHVAASVPHAFLAQVHDMADDMRAVQREGRARRSDVELLDAREAGRSRERGFTLVLTSPPYANNYDYADATRLELTVLGEISGWGGLKSYRRDLIVSCSQHAGGLGRSTGDLLSSPLLDPVREDLSAACARLTEVKEAHGGRKAYDRMVAAYFDGMARHWSEVAKVLAPGARLCYVVGDSAPYGVPVPTADWLARLAEPHGFRPLGFEKVRDRNVKWRNRKHRVPLVEGNLWLAWDG